MPKMGLVMSNSDVGTQGAATADLTAQTVSTVTIDNIVNKLNDLIQKLRSAGVIAT